MHIGLTGKVNWWYKNGCQQPANSSTPDYSKVCATAKLVQTQKLDKQAQSSARTGHVKVYYPAMELHTYGQYGPTFNAYMNNATYGTTAASDGSGTRTSVPYDRDFKLWANLSNQRNVSTLDLVDVTIDLPLAWETVAQLDGSSKIGRAHV